MLDQIFCAIASLGSAEAQSVLTSAGERFIKKYRNSNSWRNLLVNTGEFFAKFEYEETAFFEDLARVLSPDNLSRIAKDLQSNDGYDLKQKMYESFMELMSQYEIPFSCKNGGMNRIETFKNYKKGSIKFHMKWFPINRKKWQ